MSDIRSVSNSSPKSADNHVEQLRQQVGTEFTSAVKQNPGKKKNEMGKDDFMKLMSAQLKYQDPISPMKNEEMAAQLAQFSGLEQMMNVNTNLEKMTAAQKPSEHMLAASLIGKRVTTDTSHFQLEKGAQPEVPFELPASAATVNLAIFDAKGEVVREYDLGQMKQGKQSVRWDGKNGKAQEQPLGQYSFRVTALDADGKGIPIQSDTSGVVTGVTFEGGKSMLLVDGRKVPVEDVGQIEAEVPGAAAGAAAKPAGATAKQIGAGVKVAADDPAAAPGAVSALTPDKQNSSSPAAANSTSPQVAKNGLPEGLTPEKMKSMLASLAPAMAAKQTAPTDDNDEAAPPMPLWNPASN